MGGPLQKYDVTLPGGRKTVMKLNKADAERYGATLVDQDEPDEAEPEAPAEDAKPAAKRRAPANKARTATDKDGGTGGGD